MRPLALLAAGALCVVAAGCAQLFGIDPPDGVAADAAAAGDSTTDGTTEAAAADTSLGTSDASDSGSAADASDSSQTTDAFDAADTGLDVVDAGTDALDTGTIEPLDAAEAGDADAAIDTGSDCAPPAPLFPSNGTVYCPFGPDASTLACTSGTQECCYGGAIEGGFASSACEPMGATCSNGSPPKTIECADPADCADAGLVCCVGLQSPSVDGCGNLKGNLSGTLCLSSCPAGSVTVCESPVECATGMQCLPIRASSIGFGYCATSYFSASPPVAAFGDVAVSTVSAAIKLSITNGSPSSQSLSVAVASKDSPFVIINNGCTSVLPAGLPCTVQVVFTPTATGPVDGTLVVNSGGAPVATALLTGTGQ